MNGVAQILQDGFNFLILNGRIIGHGSNAAADLADPVIEATLEHTLGRASGDY
jgi:hypothetical protein